MVPSVEMRWWLLFDRKTSETVGSIVALPVLNHAYALETPNYASLIENTDVLFIRRATDLSGHIFDVLLGKWLEKDFGTSQARVFRRADGNAVACFATLLQIQRSSEVTAWDGSLPHEIIFESSQSLADFVVCETAAGIPWKAYLRV
jgi:hypothetical protein